MTFYENIDCGKLHYLSERGMIFENPKPDMKEILRQKREEIEAKHAAMLSNYILFGKYE